MIPNGVKTRLEREEGVILVLAAVLLVVLFALAALAIDIALQSDDRQQLWNSADSAALAGASQLPGDPAGAAALAFRFALENPAAAANNPLTGFGRPLAPQTVGGPA